MSLEYQNILVGVDGSPQAETALRKAVEIAKRNHARLFIVHVLEQVNYYRAAAFHDGIQVQIQDEAQKLVADYAKQCVECGCQDVICMVEKGNPKTLLALEIPEREKIDLIVTGATGLNAIERLMVGSCATYVIEHASADVLVVRH